VQVILEVSVGGQFGQEPVHGLHGKGGGAAVVEFACRGLRVQYTSQRLILHSLSTMATAFSGNDIAAAATVIVASFPSKIEGYKEARAEMGAVHATTIHYNVPRRDSP